MVNDLTKQQVLLAECNGQDEQVVENVPGEKSWVRRAYVRKQLDVVCRQGEVAQQQRSRSLVE